MALKPERADQADEVDGIRFLDDEEAREYFDGAARYLLGISGDEFLRRYDAGEYNRELPDRELRAVMKLRMLEDFVR